MMPRPLTVDRRLPCVGCRYDLRGLPTSGTCPECGRAVARTVLRPLGVPGDGGVLRRSDLHLLSELAGCPLDGLLFVRDAVRLAHPPDPSAGVTAADVVAAVGRRCRDYFNDGPEAADLLARWGLRSGEDLHRVVSALADVGLVSVASGQSDERFAPAPLFDAQSSLP